MLKTSPTGVVNYEKLITGNYYFVDKTLLIKEFLERNNPVTLVARPRRFGKTINMSMLAEFFDITKNSCKLFEGTKIMETPYKNEMNQYPTIFLSFLNAKDDLSEMTKYMKNEIRKEYKRHKHVLKDIDEFDKDEYQSIIKNLNDENAPLSRVSNAIAFLMDRLEEYYSKPVMLFIDEYDTPFIEAHVNGFYNEVKSALTSLLRTTLKSSTSLKYAFLTGIQRIAKENIFSDVNNVDVYTMANEEYAPYFGFTTEETKEILEYYGLELTDDVKLMYDGYRIGNQDIYNPWSIMNYVRRKELDSYWVNTSAVTMIRKALESLKDNTSFKKQYEKLIQNGKHEMNVVLNSSFYEDANIETLWGLFVNAGYLTIDEKIDENDYILRIPNKEVRKDFIRITEYYLSLNQGQLTNIMKYLIREDQKSFIDEYKQVLMLPSYHDLKDENSYHMMMLGMSVCLCDDYEIISNREEGKGRCDLILKAKDENKTSFVLEFKYLKEDVSNVEEKLEQLSSQAIQQIIDKKYDNDLSGKVVYIGLAHHEKDVVVKWIER